MGPSSLNANSSPSSLSADILNKRPVKHFFKIEFPFQTGRKKIVNNKFLCQSHAKVTSVWHPTECVTLMTSAAF